MELSVVCPTGAPSSPVAGHDGDLQRFTDTVRVGELDIRVAGFAVHLDGQCITGSAGSIDEDPTLRARYELEERKAIFEALRGDYSRCVVADERGCALAVVPRRHVFQDDQDPSTFRWSRSNGVAIGDCFRTAARRARWELVERDRILRSWYGDVTPRRLSESHALPEQLDPFYHGAAYAFEPDSDDGAADTRVVGVFAFPKGDGPLVYGFGARSSLREALAAASGECLQRLGFLWGEALPSEPPLPEPTAEFHQEHYLFAGHHERIFRWLSGEHVDYGGVLGAAVRLGEPVYVALTERCRKTGLFVVKALPRGHLPLGFGTGHPSLAGPVPPALRVHPIA